MTNPILADYLEAANAVYTGPTTGTTTVTPPDLTPLVINGQVIATEIDADGFSAQAFVDSAGHVVVAFEGTVPNTTTTYGTASLAADAQIMLGNIPRAFTDAESFVQRLIATDGISASDIFVTGHSLGGAEAEAVVSSISGLGGGVIFGAPGIAVTSLRTNLNLTDYVDYGDPVGNFGTDTASGALYSPQGTRHVGQVVMVGSAADGAPLKPEGVIYSDLSSLMKGIANVNPLTFGLSPANVLIGAAIATDAAYTLDTQLPFHSLPDNYAPDLGYNFLSDGTAFPLGSVGPGAPATFGIDHCPAFPIHLLPTCYRAVDSSNS
jgi:hypothetical protein